MSDKHMGILKISSHKGMAQILFKTDKDQYVNKRELDIISNGLVNGLKRADKIVKGKISIIEWDIRGHVSLLDFLKMVPLDIKLFVSIIRQIIFLIYAVDEAGMDIERIIFDINMVLINPANRELSLLYIPVQPFSSDGSVRKLFEDILQNAEYSPYEDQIYITEFLDILNSGRNIELSQLEKYAEKQKTMIGTKKTTSKSLTKKKRCPHCQSLIEDTDAYCPICGFQMDDNDVGPYLIRNNDKEKKYITRYPFVIGKIPEGTDYFIKGNGMISRKHALITKEGNRFYITDLGSTNGTYIYGKRLEPNVRYELASGMIFCLGDEEMIFYKE